MSENANPLLAKLKLPGRTFQLPSRGALYNDELTSKDGEVHIHPMTAMTEINLKNPDQLFNGSALVAALAECVPSITKPMELFRGDVDALLFFMRMTTYGSEFRIEVKHDCEGAKQHGYIVDLEKIVQQMKLLDPTTIESTRVVNLPTGHTVITRPTRFKDVIALFHQAEGKKELTPDVIKQIGVMNVLAMVESVDGVSDPKLIEDWVKGLTTPMINRITEAAMKLNDWGPDQVVTLTCKDCGGEMKVELPLNPVSFFTE